MSNIQAVSYSRYAGKRWQRYTNYAFAAQDVLVPLIAQELSKVMMHMPIAFMSTETGFVPVAVLGLVPGKNLFVAPDGRWLTGYVPALYRGYPFQVLCSDKGEHMLCINEDSGLITEGPTGESFFDEDGQLAKSVRDLMGFFKKIMIGHTGSVQCCQVLQKHGLIQPWTVTLQTDDAGEHQVKGLFRINGEALDTLAAEALHELKQSGALTLAYCQLFSMQHLPVLGQLMQAHARVVPSSTPSEELDLEFLNNGGTISFGNL